MIAYLVINAITGQKYIGISRFKMPDRRWNEHQKLARIGKRTALHAAIREDGIDAFRVETIACATTYSRLLELERILIEQHATFWPLGYNLTLGGDGVLGHRHNKEQRQKWSKERKGKARRPDSVKKTAEANLGRRHTEEAKARMSMACINRPPQTTETIAKMSATKRAQGLKWSDDRRAKQRKEDVDRFISSQPKTIATIKRKADEFAAYALDIIADIKRCGISRPTHIIQELNRRNIPSPRGKGWSNPTFYNMLKRAKNLGLACVIVMSALGFCHSAKAQIPVTDIAAQIGITKETIETVKNGITAVQSLQTAAQQLQWAISLTTSLVHDPSLGTIMSLANMLGLDTDIPVNLYAVQSLVSGYGGIGSVNGLMGTLGGKLGALGNVVNTTYGRDNLYTCQSNSFYCAQTNTNMTGLSATKGMVGTMMASLQNHLTVLTGLQSKLATSPNLKDTADINAEISTQQAWINGQTAQIQAVSAMSQMQQQVSSEQAKQAWWQSVDTFNAAAK